MLEQPLSHLFVLLDPWPLNPQPDSLLAVVHLVRIVVDQTTLVSIPDHVADGRLALALILKGCCEKDAGLHKHHEAVLRSCHGPAEATGVRGMQCDPRLETLLGQDTVVFTVTVFQRLRRTAFLDVTSHVSHNDVQEDDRSLLALVGVDRGYLHLSIFPRSLIRSLCGLQPLEEEVLLTIVVGQNSAIGNLATRGKEAIHIYAAMTSAFAWLWSEVPVLIGRETLFTMLMIQYSEPIPFRPLIP